MPLLEQDPKWDCQDLYIPVPVGYLNITKLFDPLTSGFTGTFPIVYNCDKTVSLAVNTSIIVGPFYVDTSCMVSEPTLPTPPWLDVRPAGVNHGQPGHIRRRRLGSCRAGDRELYHP
jgi:hypothetical protein